MRHCVPCCSSRRAALACLARCRRGSGVRSSRSGAVSRRKSSARLAVSAVLTRQKSCPALGRGCIAALCRVPAQPFCVRLVAPIDIFLAHDKDHRHYRGVVTATSKPEPLQGRPLPVIGWRLTLAATVSARCWPAPVESNAARDFSSPAQIVMTHCQIGYRMPEGTARSSGIPGLCCESPHELSSRTP